jgi:hypothetical protein
MKEENELLSFTDSVEDDIGLQRKKKAQAVQFNKLLNGDETFKAFERWLWRWEVQHVCQFCIESESASCGGAAAEAFPEILHKAIAEAGYTDEQLYNLHKTAL